MDCWDWLMVDRRNYQRALARSFDRFGLADLGRPEREDWNLDDNNKTHAPRHLWRPAAGRSRPPLGGAVVPGHQWKSARLRSRCVFALSAHIINPR
jgi:hypothetical protein